MFASSTTSAQSSGNNLNRINGINMEGGDIVLRDSLIKGLLRVINGNISLIHCAVETDDSNVDQSSVLVEGSNCTITIINSLIKGTVKNTNGRLRVQQTNLFSIKNVCGTVELENVIVADSVTLCNASCYVKGSHIQGELQWFGNELTVDRDSHINALKLIHSKEFIFSILSSALENISLAGGNGGPSPDEMDDNVTQYIWLESGAKLNRLEFTGAKCILTLKGTAQYTGAPHANLVIVRDGDAHVTHLSSWDLTQRLSGPLLSDY